MCVPQGLLVAAVRKAADWRPALIVPWTVAPDREPPELGNDGAVGEPLSEQ